MVRSNGSTSVLRRTLSAAGAVSLAVAGVFVTVSAASAEETPTCTPSPAWSEQVLVTPAVPATPGTDAVTHIEFWRYSWKGGGQQSAEGTSPQTHPDSWQRNTDNYPGAGHGTDPVGVAFQPNDNGNGNWFYWHAEEVTDVPAVPGTPEIPAVYKTVNHEAVECPGEVTPPTTPPVTPPTENPEPAPKPAPIPSQAPAAEPSSHVVPTKVQTDGDSTGTTLLAGGLGVLGAAALSGAGLLARSRRS